MSEADVFAKLSRIVETQNLSDDDEEEDGEKILNKLATAPIAEKNKDSNSLQGKENVSFVMSSSSKAPK